MLICTSRNRVSAFERWIDAREEKSIIIVGHSQFFKHLLGKQGGWVPVGFRLGSGWVPVGFRLGSGCMYVYL
eukprot:1381972-Amorphochlora_amoeboformis.AAC.1